jgi:hypothetical protein
MPKYRILTLDELNHFDKEFIEFLVVNGIEPEKWEALKLDKSENVDKIIELFSDVILESVLRNIKFIELKSEAYVQAIQCLPDKMISIALQAGGKSDDKSELGEEKKEMSLFKSERFYNGSREADLFEMIERGYVISNGDLFKKLQLASVD